MNVPFNVFLDKIIQTPPLNVPQASTISLTSIVRTFNTIGCTSLMKSVVAAAFGRTVSSSSVKLVGLLPLGAVL